MGKVGFGELAFWLVTLRRPTPAEVRVFEAVLVALADHGFTPTAIAARLTYLSAPDSLQGALAAGLLGGGSRFLGVTEDCGAVPARGAGRARTSCPTDDAGWDALALEAVRATKAAGPLRARARPSGAQGRGPAYAGVDHDRPRGGPPRAAPAAVRGHRPGHDQVLGRRLPLNGAGVCGAALADLGLPVDLLRGFALLARTAGLLGQLAEERRRPIGMDVYRTVDGGATYVDPSETARPEGGRMATIAAVIASTHHPFYYRASTVDRRRPAAVRRRVGGEDRAVPGDADPGPAGRAGDGGQ